MESYTTNKWKIINDPVYGFIKINSNLVFDLIQHPYFQRLRRIKQLGLTNFVYPGATHTRFQHALGSLHLMNSALLTLRSKGVVITREEEEAASVAILLHDIGHGPFSHALENSNIIRIRHENLSSLFMHSLNTEFEGQLDLAIDIFHDRYQKKFLHQLVSSQLDMDRLDYLRRDSFFTGVTEGTIGSDRIIKMLNVVNDRLVVEAKGIYSIEKYLIARRFMFWQVYLHKTVIASEQLLVKLLLRAGNLFGRKEPVFAPPALAYFLRGDVSIQDVAESGPGLKQQEIIHYFNLLDDNDIMTSAKAWTESSDQILAGLSRRLINRDLYGIILRNQAFDRKVIDKVIDLVGNTCKISPEDATFLAFSESISNHAYDLSDDKIQILYKDGSLAEISGVSDMINVDVLSSPVKKYFLCYPKELQKQILQIIKG